MHITSTPQKWMSLEETCRTLGVSDRTLRRMVSRGDVIRRKRGRYSFYRLHHTSTINNFLPTDISQSSVTEINKLKKLYTQQIKEFLGSLNDIYKQNTNGINSTILPYDSEAETMCILLSDTHVGQEQSTLIGDRIMSITNKAESVIRSRDIDEVVLMLAGDMIEGEDIFPHQAHLLSAPAIDQVKQASEYIWTLANNLAHTYDVVVRMETVPGNHGRVSRTADKKTNWDNIVYQMLGLLADIYNNDNIIVYPNFEDFRTFPVKDKIGMIHHIGPKHLGTPAMQIKVAGWLMEMGWDFFGYGHWHNWAVENIHGKPCMRNGKIADNSNYETAHGWSQPARQGWLIVTPNMPVSEFGYFQWDKQ